MSFRCWLGFKVPRWVELGYNVVVNEACEPADFLAGFYPGDDYLTFYDYVNGVQTTPVSGTFPKVTKK